MVIVYRDIKLSNFFIHHLDDHMVIKLGDYGLAKCFDMAGLSGHTVTGLRAGTPVSMSRQQLRNFKYAMPDVDPWSVVASLYWMLTDCFPRNFGDADPFSVILTVPIRNCGFDIPARLAEVIDRALDEESGSLAFKTAAELQRALRQAI